MKILGNAGFVLVITIVASAIGAYISASSAWEEKKSKRFLTVAAGVLTVLGVIINGVNAINSSTGQKAAEIARDAKQQAMLDAQRAFSASQRDLQRQSERVLELSRENGQASKLIARQGEALLNQVTGGDNWARASLFFDAVTRRSFTVWLTSDGKYRLPNLQVALDDSAKLTTVMNVGGHPIEMPQHQIINIRGNELPPHHGAMIYTGNLDGSDHRFVSLMVDSVGSHTIQTFSMRLVDGAWVVASEYEGNAGSKKINQVSVPPNYPLDSKGRPLWVTQ